MEAREIEKLVERYSFSDLEKAERALIQGKKAKFRLPGKTPGEKLAYLAAAKWIVEKIRLDKCDFGDAYEHYLQVIKEQ